MSTSKLPPPLQPKVSRTSVVFRRVGFPPQCDDFLCTKLSLCLFYILFVFLLHQTLAANDHCFFQKIYFQQLKLQARSTPTEQIKCLKINETAFSFSVTSKPARRWCHHHNFCVAQLNVEQLGDVCILFDMLLHPTWFLKTAFFRMLTLAKDVSCQRISLRTTCILLTPLTCYYYIDIDKYKSQLDYQIN